MAFRIAVLAKGGCAMAAHSNEPCGGPLDPHHVIAKQALRKHGLLSLLWDADNGLPLCRRHHERHETAVERVPFQALPMAAVEFAAATGLEYLLERNYAETA